MSLGVVGILNELEGHGLIALQARQDLPDIS